MFLISLSMIFTFYFSLNCSRLFLVFLRDYGSQILLMNELDKNIFCWMTTLKSENQFFCEINFSEALSELF